MGLVITDVVAVSGTTGRSSDEVAWTDRIISKRDVAIPPGLGGELGSFLPEVTPYVSCY